MFEGLGLGSRLAFLKLPRKYNYVPYAGALLYTIMTPLGIAIGLGVRTTYNPDSTTASIVSGTLDAISAGILLYTGLVEVRLILWSLLGRWLIMENHLTAFGTRIFVQSKDAYGFYREGLVCGWVYLVGRECHVVVG